MTRPLDRERFEKLSIFFPMWNEELYIHRAVRAAAEICEQLVAEKEIGDYEIIVVDDASTDLTGRYADELVEADTPPPGGAPRPVNRKLGGSIKSGFAAATGDLVLYTDADLPFEMIELVRAIRVLRTYEADVVSAYRLDRTGEGPRRAVYSWVYNWLIQLSFGTRLRDINFAFKLCRRTVLDRITLSSEGSFIDAELVIRAQQAGFAIVQIGVDYFPRTRGVSTLSSPAVIRTMLGRDGPAARGTEGPAAGAVERDRAADHLRGRSRADRRGAPGGAPRSRGRRGHRRPRCSRSAGRSTVRCGCWPTPRAGRRRTPGHRRRGPTAAHGPGDSRPWWISGALSRCPTARVVLRGHGGPTRPGRRAAGIRAPNWSGSFGRRAGVAPGHPPARPPVARRWRPYWSSSPRPMASARSAPRAAIVCCPSVSG